jgi:ribonuclease Z
MPVLHLLGTGAAISDPHRTTTMLAVSDEHASGRSTLVVDCGGDVLQRLQQSGPDLRSIAAVILTHEHADHVSGFPLLMEKLWLSGRNAPIPVCGIESALDQARRAFATFDTSGWDDMPTIDWRPVPHEPDAPVWTGDPWRVTSAPVDHSVPNVGLRFEHRSGTVAAYSGDTGPSDAVVDLAQGADLLVHEANGGPYDGHSTMTDAAEVAKRAGAERLVLVHLPPGDKQADLIEAQRTFGRTELGEEGGQYAL